MDQRLKNLEDLSELLTKEMVQQSKSMIEINKNLLSEIKSLREAYVKQDEDFEEFKNLLKKIYELNKQQSSMQNQNPMMHPGQLAPSQQFPSQASASSQQLPPSISLNNLVGHSNNLNNSYMVDQINQSMLNNLSFQSERTPLNVNHQNQNNSCYSIPSSASAMMLNQQTTPYINNQLSVVQQQQLIASQKSAVSYQTTKQPLPQYNNVQGAGVPNFKPIPPSQGTYQQSQMPVLPQQHQQPPPAAQPVKPFSFGNLNKPPAPQNGTDAAKLEQRQIFNAPVPQSQTTSTPQPNQIKLQPDVIKPKPPQFQFSPTKQPEASKPTSQITAAPTVTAPTITAPAPSIFGSNLFKVATPEKKTSIFGSLTESSTVQKNLIKVPEPTKVGGEDEREETAGANPEEFVPQVDFKPIVKLQEVETKTGEEEEDILLKQRCKLFRFDMNAKEWKEKGLGDIKFLKHKKTGVVRILMRREQVLKICANHRVSSSMTIKEVSPKQYSWMATDFSENEPKSELLLAKFKLVEEATEFKKEFEKSVEASKQLPSTPQKAKEGTSVEVPKKETNKLAQLLNSNKWNCDACYAPNNNDCLKCMCCGNSKPGHVATEMPVTQTMPTTNINKQISFGAQPNTQTEGSPSKPFSFGTSQPANATAKAPFSFGMPQATNNTQSKIDFSTKQAEKNSGSATKEGSSLFQFKDMPTFGSLAAKQGSSFTGGIQSTNQPAKPLFGSTLQTPKTGEAEEEGAGNDNPEEYEPQVDFKPIVKLQEVETKTGEEDEIIIFKARSKLYRFDNTLKEWKEKGTGEMKVLRHKDHKNMYRILMRREQILKLCANHRITSDLKFEVFNEKQVRWHAEDYSEGVGKHEMLAVRFKHEDEAKLFLKECNNAIEVLKSEKSTEKTPVKETKPVTPAPTELKSNLSNMFKNDNALKPGTTEPAQTASEKSLNSNFTQISFGSNTQKSSPIVFGSAPVGGESKKVEDKPAPKFDFGSKTTFGEPAAPLFGTGAASKSIFGTTTPAFGNLAPKADATSIFGKKSDISFANLAQKTQPTGFSGGFIGGGLGSGNQAKPLFGSAFQTSITTTENADEEGAGENPEEYEPQVDFAPLVKLQEVETKTGEEDEDVLFKQRCKLYRFNNELKEWKEKGVGEMKILKHKLKDNTYRILMRREQVHKLCANHRISTTLKLENVSEKQITWYVQDCSEDVPHPEILLAKFRHEEEATKFKTEVEKIQKILSNPSAPSKSDSSDAVVIIKTVEATKEQVEKARRFMLPDNFYLYENLQTCKGCRGCENES